MLIVWDIGSKGQELKFYKSIIGIRQEGHLEFNVLHWSSKKAWLESEHVSVDVH